MSGVISGTSPAVNGDDESLRKSVLQAEDNGLLATRAPECAKLRSRKLYWTSRWSRSGSSFATMLVYFSWSSRPWPHAMESPTTSIRIGVSQLVETRVDQ